MSRMRQVTEAVPRRTGAYDMLTAVDVRLDPNLRIGAGIEWAPECPVVDIGALTVCLSSIQIPDNVTSFDGGFLPAREEDPFLIVAPERCTGTFGWQNRDPAVLERRVDAFSSFHVARQFMDADGTGQDVDSTSTNVRSGDALNDDLMTTAAGDPVDVLACVEQRMSRYLGSGIGLVHVSVAVLTHLVARNALWRDGRLWRTAMGNTVVADAGYRMNGPNGHADEFDTDTQWIVGTDPVTVYLGPTELVPGDPRTPQVVADALDRSTNTMLVWAQRLALIQWDACFAVWGQVDVPHCLDVPTQPPE